MLRRAAVMVAGAVATARDKGVVQALLANLQDPDADLRIAAIEALGNLQVDEAFDALGRTVMAGKAALELETRGTGGEPPRRRVACARWARS